MGTEVALDVQGQLVGKRLVGVTMGDGEPRTLLPQLVELHRRGKFPVERLISHYRFEELDAAAADMQHGNAIKPVIRFEA